MWSFVFRRKNKRWVWLAQCRRTRQIVAFAIGDRSETTCALLWTRVPKGYKKAVPKGYKKAVPKGYKKALLYSDFWEAYQAVLPDEQHEATGKGAGQTCHIERFNNILRQRLGRFVRRTLSFSKCDRMHEMCLSLFLHEHNTNCRY